MTTATDLLAIHAITQLKYRYMRALDTRDWDLLADCFVEDATTWYAGGKLAAQGRDSIVAMLRGFLPDLFVASHIAVHPEIALTGPATATGIWRMEEDVHFLGPVPDAAHQPMAGGEQQTGAGTYYDDYV